MSRNRLEMTNLVNSVYSKSFFKTNNEQQILYGKTVISLCNVV